MKIIPAKASNVEGILEIYNHAIAHTTAVYYYDERTLEQMTEWYEEMKEKGYPVIVATEEKQILGFASYSQFRHKPAYNFTVEHSVYVHHEHRKKGLGKALLQEIVQIAKNNKVHSLIGGIDAENKGSILFHQKLGFEEVGHLKQVGYKFNKWLDLKFLQLVL